ncbi:putative cleavage/polyadenylation specificity factor, A subunit [Helianthus annuus]|nr:putative cleavage/polyadenylation specificity factor, A subunit [Helianthus annuus]
MGAPKKVEEIVQFHVGDVVACMQKASLIPGGTECVMYGSVMGSLEALLAFTSRDDVDFFSHLEMHMRQEHPPLCGRDYMAYRSAYLPVKVITLTGIHVVRPRGCGFGTQFPFGNTSSIFSY